MVVPFVTCHLETSNVSSEIICSGIFALGLASNLMGDNLRKLANKRIGEIFSEVIGKS